MSLDLTGMMQFIHTYQERVINPYIAKLPQSPNGQETIMMGVGWKVLFP